MLVNIHYSPGKMFAVHSPWLNATWSLTLWSPEQDEPSLEGRSAECGPQLPTTPPATPKIFRRPSQQHSWAPRKGGGALLCKHGLPFVQSRWISTHSSWPPRGCSKLDLQMGYSPQHRRETTQFMPAGNADVRRPPETESCYPCKAKPCVHGQRGRAVVLPAAGTALPSRVNFRDRMC